MASSCAESSRTGAERQRQNSHRRHDDDSWVSELRGDLLEEIFTRLPIKHCVQIGLVAKEFRYTWRKCRNLDFGREFVAAYSPHQLAYSDVVDHVFDSHNGRENLKTLRLCFDPMGAESLLEKWVRKSFELGVEELDLDIFQAPVPFPTNVENAKLKELKLNYAMIQLPFSLKAPMSLTTLVLREVNLNDRIVEAVFATCPQLETFDMSSCYGVRNMRVMANENNMFKVLKVGGCPEISNIEIHARSLRRLYFNGAVKRMNIVEPMFLLNEANLSFLPSTEYTSPWLVEKLVAAISVNGLAAKMRQGSIRESQFCFSNLRELQIVMQDRSFTNAGDVAAFIKNCPRLENLFIEMNGNTTESAVYSDMLKKPTIDHYMSFLNTLKFVKIRGFKVTNKQHERLVKFILQRARDLQLLVLLRPKKNYRSCRAVPYLAPSEEISYTNILASWKLSLRAEIVLCDQMEDVYSHPQHATKWFYSRR